MAIVSSPLFSKSASGRIAEKLVFSSRASGQQVRTQKKQVDVLTSARIIIRGYYSQAVLAWNLLSDSQKKEWQVLAESKQFSGYNMFVKNYIDSQVTAEQKAIFGVAIYGDSLFGFS